MSAEQSKGSEWSDDELVEKLLAGELDPAVEPARSRLARSADLRGRVESLRRLESRLAAEGREGRAALESARSAPKAELEARALEDFRATTRAHPGRKPAPRSRRVETWLAAAALLIGIGTTWWILRERPDDGSRSSISLGPHGLECLPLDSAAGDYVRFQWKAQILEGVTFEVLVYDASRADATEPIVRSPRVRTTSWEPTAEQRARMPDRIRWVVLLHDVASQVPERVECEGSRSR